MGIDDLESRKNRKRSEMLLVVCHLSRDVIGYKDSKGVFLSVNPKTDFRSKSGFRVPFGKSKSGFLIW